ncbi:PEP-CTERM sorting domain-containing protein [Akkermansia sp.]|uniref:PEP-CTERM sorting domain-containing protein n=1 Tax=Akkermansia sp. TaxID=1872421 RepID=UPI00258B9295|nr:PEP-CTERM sorting domain-containing protein [Akkermansia sp.]MCD8319269.1 PEP-CTERM sorting domain-containing protein [Akkermansia sp.]
MKKTLFLISCVVASSFMVQGATVLTLDSSALQAAGGSYTLTEGINSGYGNFSVTMVLDAQAFQDAILAGNVKANIFSANNNTIGLGLNYVSSTLTAGIYGSWRGENYTRTITSVDGSSLNLNTGLNELFTENSYESAAITYQITSTGTWTYLTLVDSEGTATTYGGKDSTLKSQDFGALTSFTYGTDYVKYLVVDDTSLEANASQEANLNAIAAAAVPEPATASLSLIGLAALMMRRRRA